MGTKWKNMENSIRVFWKAHREQILTGVLALLALALFLLLAFNYRRMNTRIVWSFGLAMNLIGAAALSRWFACHLQKHYAAWETLDEDFYEIWSARSQEQGKGLLYIAGVALAGVAVFLIIKKVTDGIWYLPNYAYFYLLLFTVLLQYLALSMTLKRFMKAKLDAFVAGLRELNRTRVARALQVEKESMEKAAKSEQLKVDLISNVSHDLKTPLTSMVGYIELLKKEELGDAARDYVEVIASRAEKLKEMISSLFSLAKASSGNIELHQERLSFNTLLEQILADMKDQIDAADLTFVVRLDAKPDYLMTDNAYLYRICQNLIENALKYAAKNTRVFIRTFVTETVSTVASPTRERRQICFEITNTSGYPIDFEKDDIVERFARGDKARSSDGNGLGLAIVSTYTAALGGNLDIMLDCDQFKVRIGFPADDGGSESETIASETVRNCSAIS